MKLSTKEASRYYFLKLAIRWSSYIRRAAEHKESSQVEMQSFFFIMTKRRRELGWEMG
jgi:hypothetical protein